MALAPEPRAAPSPPPARQASAAPVAAPSAPPWGFLLQQAGPPSRRVSQARAPSLPHAPAPGPAWAAERSSARQEPAPGGRESARTASQPASQPAAAAHSPNQEGISGWFGGAPGRSLCGGRERENALCSHDLQPNARGRAERWGGRQTQRIRRLQGSRPRRTAWLRKACLSLQRRRLVQTCLAGVFQLFF